tara:strand:+ start:4693 stop:4881 length:189 start_codon:yes stop_codon:yes gene_type:complete
MSLTGEIEHLRQEWQDALGYLLGYIDEEQWEDAIVSYGDASNFEDNADIRRAIFKLWRRYGA